MKSLIILILATSLVGLSHCNRQNGQRGDRRNITRTRTPEEKLRFREWRQKHRKQYRSQDEEEAAMEKMLTNKKKIDEHNKLFEQGEVSFKRSLWEHSDMSDEDKQKYLMGLTIPPETRSLPAAPSLPQFPPGPVSVDWRAKGLVGPVEGQGWCGSCWAFSAAGVIEGVLRRKNITAVVAPQQLVDCSKKNCWGCSSGWPKYALDYVKSNGIAKEISYPYVGYDQTCAYSKNMSIGYINATFNIPTRGNETWLRDIVASVGPVSIAMSLSDSFYNYESGLYYQEGCSMTLNHAMLITGYGTDPVYGDYWNVKNSWGDTWGEQGYARVARNAGNMCNIAYYAVYAT